MMATIHNILFYHQYSQIESLSQAESAWEPINLAILKPKPYHILLIKLIIKFNSDGIFNGSFFRLFVPFYFFLSGYHILFNIRQL